MKQPPQPLCMKITYDIHTLKVSESSIVKTDYTGYRIGNNFLLSQKAFRQYHDAICMDKFDTMRSILDSCIDLLTPEYLELRKEVQKFLY